MMTRLIVSSLLGQALVLLTAALPAKAADGPATGPLRILKANPRYFTDGGYLTDPPPAAGSKVILSDTDHLGGLIGDRPWVWKSFARGLNCIFMDPYDGAVLGLPFDPSTGKAMVSADVEGGRRVDFQAPFSGDTVLYLSVCPISPVFCRKSLKNLLKNGLMGQTLRAKVSRTRLTGPTFIP